MEQQAREARLAGAPAGARLAAHVPGSVAKSHTLNARSESIRAGGVPYEGPSDSVYCNELKNNGDPCTAKKTSTGRCVGHEKRHQARQK